MSAALELIDLHKSFGQAQIIRGVDLKVEKGQRHAIIGPNGAGKSTLFNLITGRFEPTSGSVRLHGEEVNGLAPFEINRKGLSRSFQITNIFPKMTVFENVRVSLLWSQGYRYSFWTLVNRQRPLNEEADRILEEINLTERRNLPAGVLSYAEQRALEIGITMAGGAANPQFDSEETGEFPIEVEIDGEIQKDLIAPGADVVFGRHESSSFVLPDPHASRRQFRVANLGNKLEVAGLPSKNRTHVLGRRVDEGVFLSSPDVWVRVGNCTVKLRRK